MFEKRRQACQLTVAAGNLSSIHYEGEWSEPMRNEVLSTSFHLTTRYLLSFRAPTTDVTSFSLALNQISRVPRNHPTIRSLSENFFFIPRIYPCSYSTLSHFFKQKMENPSAMLLIFGLSWISLFLILILCLNVSELCLK